MNIKHEVDNFIDNKIWASIWSRFYDDVREQCDYIIYLDVGNHVNGRVRISTQRMTDALRASISEYEY